MTALWGARGELEHPDYPEAVRIALANPGAALDSLWADGVIEEAP
ncbi:MAG TPA: hypothetical protein VFE23_05445 [Usitatibacter sp.]|jgi:hypothetical protein|nr:hypothetical protein [Usitatibacter sp.]